MHRSPLRFKVRRPIETNHVAVEYLESAVRSQWKMGTAVGSMRIVQRQKACRDLGGHLAECGFHLCRLISAKGWAHNQQRLLAQDRVATLEFASCEYTFAVYFRVTNCQAWNVVGGKVLESLAAVIGFVVDWIGHGNFLKI